MPRRAAAVAGTWYPGTAGALARQVDEYVEAADAGVIGDVVAIVAPHAGLMFSGPVGAHAYKVLSGRQYDVALLVGPSHFEGFQGVAVWPDGVFSSPLGDVAVHAEAAAEILAGPVAVERPSAHGREHSLEMQLPFLRRLMPDVPIVPMLMGYQDRDTIEALASALAGSAARRRTLLIASTDLSHYFDAKRASALDERVQAHMAAFDVDGLLATFERYPEAERGRYVACGGGPALAVMLAARQLGARHGRVLKYAHSGEVSGDNDGVVGYVAAAFGTFENGVEERPRAH